MQNFIFGGNTPWSYDQLQRQRQVADAMAASLGTPKNVGEGLAAVGKALAVRGINRRADKEEAAQRDAFDAKWGQLFGGGSAMPVSAPQMASAPARESAFATPNPAGLPPSVVQAVDRVDPQIPTDFAKIEQTYGLPAGYLDRVYTIESGRNPDAQNPNSSAGGGFQFIDSTAQEYGLTDKRNLAASADAAARLAADNKAALTRALGREPTAAELYLAHQQGGGGASALLSNPNARAVDVVGQDAVMLNGGDPNMTAGDFAGKWTGKFGGQSSGGQQMNIGALAELAGSPYASPSQKAVANALLQQQMQANDPMARIELERAQLELQQMRDGGGEGVPDAVRSRLMLAQEAGLQPGTPEYQSYVATGQLPTPGGGSEFGLNPVYGTDADGNVVVMQLGKDGTAVATRLPEGVTPDLAVKTAEQERGKIEGQAAGQAITGASSAVAKADITLDLINQIKTDPTLPSITGIVQGNIPAGTPLVGGGQAGADLNVKIEQLKGRVFLEAFESLKGAGQITEREGAAAQAALARLDRAQSPDAYQQALAELETIVRTARDRAQLRAAEASGQPVATPVVVVPTTTQPQNGDDPLGIFQ
jgi:hypothetical protein